MEGSDALIESATAEHSTTRLGGKRLGRWRNGRSRLVPAGVGIVIAMHMVSRTIKRNSHSALQDGKGKEWDFRVRFNRTTWRGRIVLRKHLPRTPCSSRSAPRFPRSFPFSPVLHLLANFSAPLFTVRSRVRHFFTRRRGECTDRRTHTRSRTTCTFVHLTMSHSFRLRVVQCRRLR